MKLYYYLDLNENVIFYLFADTIDCSTIYVTEKLPAKVPVELFPKLAVEKSRIVLHEQCQTALGEEDGPTTLFGFLQFECSYHFVPRDRQIYFCQIALEKSGVKDIELLCLGRKGEGVPKSV